jgi:hypothetical protein
MINIVSLIISIVIAASTAILGLTPGDNPSSNAKSIGPAVSEAATSENPSNTVHSEANSSNVGQGAEKSEDNFGSWVASLPPEEPKADGAVFGEKVSEEAKEEGQNENEPAVQEPPVILPVEPVDPEPIDPPDKLPRCDGPHIMIFPPICMDY